MIRFVVAGNKKEFDEYRKSNTNIKLVYVTDKYVMLGHIDYEVMFYGTYYNRKDISDIEKVVNKQSVHMKSLMYMHHYD